MLDAVLSDEKERSRRRKSEQAKLEDSVSPRHRQRLSSGAVPIPSCSENGANPTNIKDLTAPSRSESSGGCPGRSLRTSSAHDSTTERIAGLTIFDDGSATDAEDEQPPPRMLLANGRSILFPRENGSLHSSPPNSFSNLGAAGVHVKFNQPAAGGARGGGEWVWASNEGQRSRGDSRNGIHPYNGRVETSPQEQFTFGGSGGGSRAVGGPHRSGCSWACGGGGSGGSASAEVGAADLNEHDHRRGVGLRGSVSSSETSSSQASNLFLPKVRGAGGGDGGGDDGGGIGFGNANANINSSCRGGSGSGSSHGSSDKKRNCGKLKNSQVPREEATSSKMLWQKRVEVGEGEGLQGTERDKSGRDGRAQGDIADHVKEGSSLFFFHEKGGEEKEGEEECGDVDAAYEEEEEKEEASYLRRVRDQSYRGSRPTRATRFTAIKGGSRNSSRGRSRGALGLRRWLFALFWSLANAVSLLAGGAFLWQQFLPASSPFSTSPKGSVAPSPSPSKPTRWSRADNGATAPPTRLERDPSRCTNDALFSGDESNECGASVPVAPPFAVEAAEADAGAEAENNTLAPGGRKGDGEGGDHPSATRRQPRVPLLPATAAAQSTAAKSPLAAHAAEEHGAAVLVLDGIGIGSGEGQGDDIGTGGGDYEEGGDSGGGYGGGIDASIEGGRQREEGGAASSSSSLLPWHRVSGWKQAADGSPRSEAAAAGWRLVSAGDELVKDAFERVIEVAAKHDLLPFALQELHTTPDSECVSSSRNRHVGIDQDDDDDDDDDGDDDDTDGEVGGFSETCGGTSEGSMRGGSGPSHPFQEHGLLTLVLVIAYLAAAPRLVRSLCAASLEAVAFAIGGGSGGGRSRSSSSSSSSWSGHSSNSSLSSGQRLARRRGDEAQQQNHRRGSESGGGGLREPGHGTGVLASLARGLRTVGVLYVAAWACAIGIGHIRGD